MSITERFNPDPDTQHGKCKTCDLDLPTRQEVDIHLNATMAEATARGERGGHTIRILNPSREIRIENEVGDLIDDAIADAMSNLEDLVYRNHITEAEAKKAISQNTDFADAWDEHCND